jgi:FkbM family methyltransferase
VEPTEPASDFLDVENSRIALYGASGGGVVCYNYIKEIGLDENVCFFIDGNPEKHGKKLLDKEIFGAEHLKNNEDIAVVISTMYFNDVYKKLREMGCTNKIFAYVGLNPLYEDNSPFNAAMENILRFYDSCDIYTRNVVGAVVRARKKEVCHIQPAEKCMFLSGNESYWYSDGTSLSAFDELTICDGGAFIGDTAKFLYGIYGEKIKRYYAFEPDLEIFSAMCNNLSFMEGKKEGRKEGIITPCPYGLGDKNEKLSFIATGPEIGHRFDRNGEVACEVKSLDSLSVDVYGKLCIKMDIEGYELRALEGARETIMKYMPNLAICVYHKPNDIWEIPKYIKSINPEYSCILRGGIHMVCYASVPQ